MAHAPALMMALTIAAVAGFLAFMNSRLNEGERDARVHATHELHAVALAFSTLFDATMRLKVEGALHANAFEGAGAAVYRSEEGLLAAHPRAALLAQAQRAAWPHLRKETLLGVLFDTSATRPKLLGVFATPSQSGLTFVVASADEGEAGKWAQSVLGDQEGGFELKDAGGQSLGWVTPKRLLAAHEAPPGPLTHVSHATVRTSAERQSWVTGEAVGLPAGAGGRMSVRAAVAQSDLLHQFLERRSASMWLAPLMCLFVLGVVGLASFALHRLNAQERKNRALATRDTLTGLFNRGTFTNLLELKVNQFAGTSRKTALFFLDLDNFKYVNDSFGHDAGDALLKEVARRLRKSVRTEDIVCRLGGDEFTVIVPGLENEQQAADIAQRILDALSVPVSLTNSELLVQSSIGIAFSNKDASTAMDLIRCADQAVYQAKAEGKACYVIFDEKIADEHDKRSQIVTDLRGAITRREFFLVYQPKMDLATETVCGFEALVRWNHPQRGPIPPLEFIGVAETAGLIVPLGNYVIREALTQMRAWYEGGRGWQSVAINISPMQLRDDKIVEVLRSTLAEFEVPAEYVQIEVTESSLMADMHKTSRLLDELKKLGLKVSVDDFGTGYSSLSALQGFDVDYLKVDRSFVSRALTDSDSFEICKAIVNLAHSLRLRVVAEGVETTEQAELLRSIGCEECQGFYFGKPMPPWRAVVHFAPTEVTRPIPLEA